jgi:hypothetical protein
MPRTRRCAIWCGLDAVHALRRARQQLSGFLLRHGCHYGRPAWTKLHRRWLAGLSFEQAVHHIVLEDYIGATVNAIAAWPRFVAKSQGHPVAAELAQQTLQRRRRVGDPAILPHLAAHAALRHRDNDAFLVNIKTNVGNTIHHDPSPMHEARHRPIRRNPRYLHTVRRVAPSSGGHVV